MRTNNKGICEICKSCIGNWHNDYEMYICKDCLDEIIDNYNDEIPYNELDINSYMKDHTDEPPGKWDSGLHVITPDEFKVIINFEALRIIKSVEKKINKNLEFSILFKGYFNDKDGVFVVTNDYAIPKQKISPGSVDYEENLDNYIKEGYNVVMHKHPDGIRTFSSSDEESINSNFDCSLLYCNGEITDATMRIKISDNIMLKIKPEVEIVIDLLDIDIDGIIQEKVINVNPYKRNITMLKLKGKGDNSHDRNT